MKSFQAKQDVILYRKKKAHIRKPKQEEIALKRKQISTQEKMEREAKWLEEIKQEKFILENAGEYGKIGLEQVLEEQIHFMQGESLVKEVLQELKHRNSTFYDISFPPSQYSLCGKLSNGEWKKYSWERISDKIKNATIFSSLISPQDIIQGTLGDCYFLSALAALAEIPERIRNLFIVTTINEQQFFAVKILQRGVWKLIYLDQMFPFSNVKNRFAFSKPSNDMIWVMLLEKAWAKLFKSYLQIEGGDPEQSLHDLTGAPVKKYNVSKYADVKPKRSKLWEKILQGTIEVYPMVACSININGSSTQEKGIEGAHAYTLLQAVQVFYNKKSQKLIQLRNPWGRSEYTGKWSDDDEVWEKIPTEERERVGFYGKKNDGIFFMPYSQFMKYFKFVIIAEVDDQASYVYQSFQDKQQKGVYFSIAIIKEGWYSFQIDKTPDKALNLTYEEDLAYEYPTAELQLFSIGKEQNQMLGRFKPDRGVRTLYQKYILKPGKYVAFARINFDQYETDFDVTLAIYGQYSCGIYLSSPKEVREVSNLSHDWLGQIQQYSIKPKSRTQILSKINKPANLDLAIKLIFENYSQNNGKDSEKLTQLIKKNVELLNLPKIDEQQNDQVWFKSKGRLQPIKRQISKDPETRSQTNTVKSIKINDFIEDFMKIGNQFIHEKQFLAKKKKVVKKTIKSTVTTVQKHNQRMLTKQTIQNFEKINAHHYVSRSQMEKKIVSQKQMTETRETYTQQNSDPSTYYSKTVNQTLKSVGNKNGELKRTITSTQQEEYLDDDQKSEQNSCLLENNTMNGKMLEREQGEDKWQKMNSQIRNIMAQFLKEEQFSERMKIRYYSHDQPSNSENASQK